MMQTYIALLRGINVSGQKKILMADLKKLLMASGFKEVRTYIQSGNVVFTSMEDPTTCQKMIVDALEEAYGFVVPTLILTPAQLKNIVTNSVFKDEALLKSYFTLLHSTPQPDKVAAFATYSFPKETFVLVDSCIYSYPENGAGRAKANNNFFEKKLDVIATTRNYRTLIKFLEMLS